MNITMEWSKRRLKVLLLGLLSFVMTYAILFNIGQEQNKKGPYHSECQCFRPFIHFEANQENIAETDLTCSKEASLRGSHQKVITFTFYEATREEKSSFDAFQRDYFAGIEDNLLLLSQLYGHEWVMRLYYQFSSKQSPTWTRLCSLVCNHANIDICDAETNPKLGNMSKIFPLNWRFLPAVDPQVDVLLVRDLDSQISRREVAAVNDFLSSPYDFHIMRDHPNHGIQILGGTWGVKLHSNQTRNNFKRAFLSMSHDANYYASRRKAGPDQTILKTHVWPWAKRIAIAHDSYFCKKFSMTRPFPTQRERGIGNFIGAVVAINNSIPFEPSYQCPDKCRPKNHQDWLFC